MAEFDQSLERAAKVARTEGFQLDESTARLMARLHAEGQNMNKKRRVGFVGYGFLGKNLVKMLLEDKNAQDIMELAFVTDLACPSNVMDDPILPQECKAENLDKWQKYNADLIVEVSHPSVSKNWGAEFLKEADYMLASTTCFADADTERILKAAANELNGHGVYMTAGALFGSLDIQKMSDMGKLTAMHVIMKKHPNSLYPTPGSPQFVLNEQSKEAEGEVVLFEGTVRDLAGIFPRNVNTICTAAVAAWSSVGMDGATACVIADSGLEKMVIDVHLEGVKNPTTGKGLTIDVVRQSPAGKTGEVTSPATVASFLASLLQVAGNPPRGNGLHLC